MPSGGTSDTGGAPNSSGLFGNVGAGAATAGSLFNIEQGLRSGGVAGNAQAALGTAGLANRAGAFGGTNSNVGYGLGAAGGALGIYNGLRQGGVSGYGGAAVGGLRVGQGVANIAGDTSLGSTLGGIAGVAGAGLSVYNAAKNWQQGAVGSNTINSAEAGAAIGSIIPGVGTIVGGLVGGAVGALGSLAGNPGEREATLSKSIDSAYNQASAAGKQQIAASLTPSQNVQYLQSIMSAETNSAGHSTGLEQAFGRNNVNGFVTDMTQQIASQIKAGKVPEGASSEQIYNSVVLPWLQSKGATAGLTTGQKDAAGNQTGGAMAASIQSLISQWQNGSLNQYTSVGSGGQNIAGLIAYPGSTVSAPPPAPAQKNTSVMG